MKTQCALTWMVGLMLLACSGEKGDRAASQKGDGQKTAEEKAAQESAKPSAGEADKEVNAEQPAKKIKARAVTEPVEGTQSQSLEITLDVKPSDQVQGTVTLEGNALSVRGTKRGDHLRLWVFGEEGDPSKVRRGYLIGTLEGDKVKGSFAISGNGGEPANAAGVQAPTIRRASHPRTSRP